MKEKVRDNNLDCLRIIATIFVLILHFDGFFQQATGIAESSEWMIRLTYRLSESFAYCAIHIFVLISSYYLLKSKFSIRRLIIIWLSTVSITFIGAIIIWILSPNCISIKGMLQSIFPLTTQAYWYVSAYVVLLLISPFLNKLINILTDKELLCLTGVLLVGVSIGPTFLQMFDDYVKLGTNIAVFILLYFIAAVYRRKDIYFTRIWGMVLYIGCVCVLIISIYLIELLSCKGYIPVGNGWLFFNYQSIFVICEAVGLFIFFEKKKNCKSHKVVTVLARNSLFVYMIHMHPIAKNYYVEWNLFKGANISSPLDYYMLLIGTVFVVYLSGVLIGEIVAKLVNFICNRMEKITIYNKVKQFIEIF